MKNKLNKILQHHVSIHKSEVDPQEIWDGILAKQKPKRRNWFLYLIPLCLLLAFYYASFLPMENPIEQTAAFSQLQTKPLKELPQVTEEFSTLTNKKRIQSESALGFSNRQGVSAINSTSNDLIKNKTSHSTQIIKSLETKNYFHHKVNQKSTPTATTPQNKNKALFNTTKFAIKKKNRIVRNEQNRLHTLPISQPSLIFSNRATHKIDLSINTGIEPLNLKPFLSINLLGGIAYVSSSIKENEQISAEYITARRNSESNLEALIGKLSVGISLGKGFSLNSGVEYLRLNEKFDWQGSYLSDAKGSPLSGLERDSEGNPIVNLAFFTEEYYIATEQKITAYNKHEYLTIPLSIGYDLQLGRLRSNFKFGSGLTVLSNSRGQLLNEKLLPAYYQDKETIAGLKFFSSLSLDYPISNWIALTTQLEYASQSVTTYKLTKKYKMISANFGISYQLN